MKNSSPYYYELIRFRMKNPGPYGYKLISFQCIHLHEKCPGMIEFYVFTCPHLCPMAIFDLGGLQCDNNKLLYERRNLKINYLIFCIHEYPSLSYLE